MQCQIVICKCVYRAKRNGWLLLNVYLYSVSGGEEIVCSSNAVNVNMYLANSSSFIFNVIMNSALFIDQIQFIFSNEQNFLF